MPTAFKPADILIPKNTDMKKWSVIACDQYTSEPEYWNKLYELIGDSKSALNLVLPEVYLESPDIDKRIEEIHKTMNEYLESDVFEELKDSMIYVERTQSNGKIRRGVIGMIDLEEYDYSKNSQSEIRATEATVIERIPPRIRVREGASLELPHIMILIDDENKSIVENLSYLKKNMRLIYDFDLYGGSGHINGYLMNGKMINNFQNGLENLGNKEKFKEKYGSGNVLLYAMGDGNHSLATAKTYYENLKKSHPEIDFSNHPSRYALCEIVNLHSSALEFEAIHRLVYNTDVSNLISSMNKALGLSNKEKSDQCFSYFNGISEHTVYIHKKTSNLTVGSLQNFLDSYLKSNNGKLDYIHGKDTIKSLTSKKKDAIGFILPDMKKSDLFSTVIKDGSLPRKTFSMGRAEDKRFYIECRKIIF